jgi:hypothetical protein
MKIQNELSRRGFSGWTPSKNKSKGGGKGKGGGK